ncbi:cation-translocating P-type ATPase [Ideonella sp.]|uniref:cation-translocating P-type ATPase n=1 Tax=Ideonella sp. TaxID=1929293 RepID=UPI002B4A90C6|nr:cation-translocating P-type ATPase [Ideonella sp.]HJV68422.1 cation-translocating P-type ATPase [Ideonella sp.]
MPNAAPTNPPPSAPPAPAWHEDAHLRHTAELARQLGVQMDAGLAADEVAARQARHGPNRLPEAPPRPAWKRLLDQFRDFMILVLLAAALLSSVIGDLADTLVIVVIVLLNAAIGFWQEWRADQAMQALRRIAAPQATVRRGEGQVQVIATDELVPGDVVLLEAGDLVPADLRLHGVVRLRVDESALTGESATVEKVHGPLPEGERPLGDRVNMAYKGTLVTHGRAEGLVVATGAATQLGQVATLLGQAESRATPLQQRLAAFGRRLSIVVLAICALIFAIGVLRGEPVLLMALTSISLAVAAIPEALPAVVTVLLALGARRLVTVNALVRRLPSVETLGSVTVICSDKTGTLTQNRMQVREHRAWGGDDGALWTAMVLCNDARPAADGWLGDPTETALLQAAQDAGLDVAALQRGSPRRHEWPFDAERKRMGTLHGAAGGSWRAYVKGAPESVLPRCRGEGVDDALATAHAWAAQGMRVLAVAWRDGHEDVVAVEADAFERGLTLIGLVGLIDPPRPEARAAVTECLAAGVRPVMITGDHPATALAIARDLGIVGDGDDAVLTGAELARMDEPALAAAVPRVSVYARTDPAQKIRIVQALQAAGQFVAMTGDGVNDAPALRQADIGVAMGRGGTDVAREAASLVLLDDNFATIVGAVREGRRIFDNIRKFIRYALTGNSGEVWVLFLAPLLALPIPLLPIHILWVNLVTDGLPGLALAAEPAERGVMQRPPRPPGESVFAHGLWQHALWVGLLIGALCLGVQAWALEGDGAEAGRGRAQTMVFTVLTLAQMAHLLAIRSESASLWTQGLGSNLPLLGAVLLTLALQLATIYLPWLQPVFHTHALSATELALCIGLSAVVFVAVEIEKWWRRRAAGARVPAFSAR